LHNQHSDTKAIGWGLNEFEVTQLTRPASIGEGYAMIFLELLFSFPK
jgi:hypothetical protein